MAAVIGDPVSHSRSPAIHNAAFEALGLDWVFVALRVAAGSGAEAAASVRTLGLGGLSVTMPHKVEVIASLDDLTDQARRLGAVNCISAQSGSLVGHNTDGEGFLAALDVEGVAVRGRRCVVLGAGGAARAVTLALGDAGAGEVRVLARSIDRAAEAASLAGPAGRSGSFETAATALRDADLLVNATPIGMRAGDPCPVPVESLHSGLVVSDLIYHPESTPLLAAAHRAGLAHHNGLQMLVHQAGAALRIWTGREPPIEVMSAAAEGVPGADPD